MIIGDQPSVFSQDLCVRISSRRDGSMLDRTGKTHPDEVIKNRTSFCAANDVAYNDVVFQKIVYDESQTYDRIVSVTKADIKHSYVEVEADAVFTKDSGVALFLPVADCVATVVYDPVLHNLALVHLGRYSTLTELVAKVMHIFKEAGSDASDIKVWMSPSAQQQTYRLEYFLQADELPWRDYCDVKQDGFYVDMSGYNRARFIEAGVLPGNIEVSTINTMTNKAYFSHAAGDLGGRMAVLAVMR